MKSLHAYISNIDPQLLQHVTGKMGDFIQAFQTHHFVSEAAFIEHICGEKYTKRYYDNLKYRTKRILQALALVSTFEGSGRVKKKLDLCRKNFTMGQKFLGKGERHEGLRLIKKAYRDAVSYDFVHMAAELANVLYFHYTYYQRKPKQAAIFAKQVEHYTEAYKIEKKAEYYVFEAIAQEKVVPDPNFLKEAVVQVDALAAISLKAITYKLMLRVLYGSSKKDYELIIQNCIQALDFFKDKKGVYISHHFFFFTNLGIAQMATTRYEKANQTFVRAKKYVYPRSLNGAIIALYRTVNALHAGQYRVAYELYYQNRKCKFEEIRQQFAIIEAYLCFLSHHGYLQLEKTFRLGKYLNDTFKSQAEKQGTNIAIVIAELLVYFVRDRGKFIDRIESVNTYSYRHLKNSDTRRAKRFMKILCLMPRANFNPIALKRIAHKEMLYLQEHPISMGENVAIEIIPFEKLLDMILIQLERKVA